MGEKPESQWMISPTLVALVLPVLNGVSFILPKMHSSHRQSAERVVCIFTILASFVLVVIASVLAIRLEDRPELESRFCDSFEPSLRLAWLPLEAYAVSVFCCCMTREGWLTKNAVSAGASIPSFLILSRCSSVTSLAIRFPTVC